MKFEKGHKYIIEYEKNRTETITYTGIVLEASEQSVEIKTIRGEKVGIRLKDIKRKTELTDGVDFNAED